MTETSTRRRGPALAVGVLSGVAAIALIWVAVDVPPTREARSDTNTLQVSCSERGAAVADAEVSATTSGISVAVRSEAPDLVFVAVAAEGGPIDTLILPLSEELTNLSLPFPPKDVRLGCFSMPFDGRSLNDADLATVRVTDPDGVWLQPSLDCTIVAEKVARVEQGEPQSLGIGPSLREQVVQEFPWLDSGDVFEPVMYQDNDMVQSEVVVRDGVRVAGVTLLTIPAEIGGAALSKLTTTECDVIAA